MRWQQYFPENEEGMILDLYSLDLSTLYKMQADIEKHLAELRNKEPFSKRKNEQEHKVWFMQCHAFIDDLKKIKDAIEFKKTGNK